MSTATDIAETVQDSVLKALETTQHWTLEAARAVASTVDSLVPNRPTVPFADRLPEPHEAVASTFNFAEKVLATNRTFLTELASIGIPAGRPAAVKKTPSAS
jgi:hypothetical protein